LASNCDFLALTFKNIINKNANKNPRNMREAKNIAIASSVVTIIIFPFLIEVYQKKHSYGKLF